MKKQLVLPTQTSMREFSRRGRQILLDVQKQLLPDHASDVLAINVETGEYVLASTKDDAYAEFHKRWPDKLSYVVRADGSPVTKFHGK